MKVIYAVSVFLILVLVSCNDSTVGHSLDNTIASTRGSQNLSVELVTTESGTINLDADVVTISNVSGNSFTVVIDDLPAYTATSINVRHDDAKLRIVKNPNQITYSNKSLLEVTSSSNLLQMSIDGGGIITGTSVVVDEIETI